MPTGPARQKWRAGFLCPVISNGIQTFAEVGNALLAIRDGRLYKAEFKTFELYCSTKWGIKQTRAYQLMEAAKVTNQLKSSKILELPSTESHAAPLAKLPASEQPAAWQAVFSCPVAGQHLDRRPQDGAPQGQQEIFIG
jgi:hypothetical protein